MCEVHMLVIVLWTLHVYIILSIVMSVNHSEIKID